MFFVEQEKAEAESRKILNMNSMENALRYLNSSRYSPSPSYGYCSPSPSCSSVILIVSFSLGDLK